MSFDMRELIDLVEARKPHRAMPAPVGIAALKAHIDQVTAELRRRPFHLEFDPALANAVMTRAREIIDGSDAGASMHDAIEDALDWVYRNQRHWLPQFLLSRELGVAEHEYQLRAAERHDRLDDPDFYIEDSQWLHGMQAQKDLGDAIRFLNPNSASDATKMVAAIQSFIETFRNASTNQDEGEDPFLLDALRSDLGRLLPLLTIRYCGAPDDPGAAR